MREVGSPDYYEIGTPTATKQVVRNSYEGSSNFYEVGNNDMIRRFLSRINDPDVLAFMGEQGLTIYVDGDIVDTPKLVGSVYEKQQTCRVGIGFSTTHEIDAVTALQALVTGGVSNLNNNYTINVSDKKE
jgi:ribosomal protein L10